MAYATIAGLPVQVGLYTAIVPMAVYAALGTSRPLSVSTTTTIAILSAAALGQAAPGGSAGELIAASATLAILVGALLALASAARLGFVANFISEPVLTGFKSGIGVVIVVDQLPKLLGIHITKAGFFQGPAWPSSSMCPRRPWRRCSSRWACSLLIFALEHFVPHSPAPLVAIAPALPHRRLLSLSESGVAADRSGPGRTALPGPPAPRPRVDHVARGSRHRPHELYREHRRGAGFRGSRRAAAAAQPRAARARRRQRGRRPARRDAGRRRHVADRGQSQGGSAHAARVARDRGRVAGDVARPGPLIG